MSKGKTTLPDETKKPAILHFLKRPKGFQGVSSGSLEAYFWIERMNELQKVCQFSDNEMIFMVGDYLTGSAKDWYRVAGSVKKTWSDFIDAFRVRFIHEELLEREKMTFFNRVDTYAKDDRRLLQRAFEYNEEPGTYDDIYD